MGDKAPPPPQTPQNKPAQQQQPQQQAAGGQKPQGAPQQQQQGTPRPGPSGGETPRKKPSFTVGELVDLALASPEVGAVNFNILRMLLRDIVEKTGIDKSSVRINDVEAHQVENYKNYTAGASIASPMPGILRIGQQGPGLPPQTPRGPPQQARPPGQGQPQGAPPAASQAPSTPRQGQPGGPQGGQQGGPPGAQQVPRTPRTPRPPPGPDSNPMTEEILDKIDKLEQQLEALYQLPANNEILQKAVGDTGHSVNDMWQIIQLNNRIAAAEAAIQKMASLIEDLAKNMGKVKGESKALKKDTETLTSKISNSELAGMDLSDQCAKFVEQVNTLTKDLNDVKAAWKQDRDNLEKMLGVDLGKVPSSMKPRQVSPRREKQERQAPTSTSNFERGTQTFVHKGDERARSRPKKAKEEFIPPEEIAKMSPDDIMANITPEELKAITPTIYKEFSAEQKKALNEVRKRGKEQQPRDKKAVSPSSPSSMTKQTVGIDKMTSEEVVKLSPRTIKKMSADEAASIPQHLLDQMSEDQRDLINQVLASASSDSLASLQREINDIKKAWIQDREKLEKMLGIDLGKTPSLMKIKEKVSRLETSRSERETQTMAEQRGRTPSKPRPKKPPEEYVSPDEMLKMTPEEILEKITSEELRQITTAKFKEFSPEQKKALTDVRKRAKTQQAEGPKKPAVATIGVATMSPEEIQKLPVETIEKMNPAEAASIPPTVLEQMNEEQKQMVAKIVQTSGTPAATSTRRGSGDKLAGLYQEIDDIKRAWLKDREHLEKVLGVNLGKTPSVLKIRPHSHSPGAGTPRSDFDTQTEDYRDSKRGSKTAPKKKLSKDYIPPWEIAQMSPQEIIKHLTPEEIDQISSDMYEDLMFSPEQMQAIKEVKKQRKKGQEPQSRKRGSIEAAEVANMSPEQLESLAIDVIADMEPEEAAKLPSEILNQMSREQRETVQKVISKGRARSSSAGSGRGGRGDPYARSERETQTGPRSDDDRNRERSRSKKKSQKAELTASEIAKMTPYDIMHHAPADDLKHKFPAVYKEFKKGEERDSADMMDEEIQAIFPGDGKHKGVAQATLKSLLLLDLEKIREEMRTKGVGTFDEQDIMEKLGAVWEALKILKHNEEALAIKIARQDAVMRKIPQKAIEKLQKVPDENMEALITGNFGKGVAFIDERKTAQAKELHELPKALQSTWRGPTGMGTAEREDIQTLFNNLANVISECSDQKERLDEIADITRGLETGMVTKQMLIDALQEKADKGMVNTKVSFDEFGNTIDELHTQLHNLMVEGYQRNENWKKVTSDLADELAEKIDKAELAPIRAFFKSHLKALEEKVKNLSRLIEEPDPAGTRKKILKDYNCLSCDRAVNISGVTNGPRLPVIGPILAGHTTASKQALDLQRMRLYNHFEPQKKNLNALERQGKQNEKMKRPPTTPTEKQKDKDVMPAVNRYTGGSHTEITNADVIAATRRSSQRSNPIVVVKSNTGIGDDTGSKTGLVEGDASMPLPV